MSGRTYFTGGRGEVAQTTLDFAIAMGVFLLAVAFVFTFIPSLTAPFLDGGQDHSAVSDRTASHLAEGGLGDPNQPYVVNESCATDFFADDPYCGFDGETLNERLGLSDRHQVNVTMYRVENGASHRVCLSEDGDVTHEAAGNCDDDHRYAVGSDVSDGASTTVTRRVVSFEECEFNEEGCDVTLFVEVW